ncbi:alpha/beta hydrolase [Shewanella vesiculosa]|uniref:alpha/beta hydrolase n=1 Tax=Shewanella vesiculosa TaxID=518738 RepID=UPI003CFDE50E
MKTTVWLIVAIMCCWLSLSSASTHNDSVLAGLPNNTADVHSSAALVNIPRTRQFVLEDGDRHYQVMIKLPKDYRHNSTHRYPVVYMTDSMYSLQVVSGATRFPMNTNMMQQAILVAIGYQRPSKGSASRIRDYTPSHDASWKLPTGEAKRHVAFISQVVMPFIEKNYRVDTQQNTFVGNSLGGLLGAYILLEQPKLFAYYVLGSPSLWFDNKQLLQQFAQRFQQTSAISAKVFIGIGELEKPPYTHDGHQMVTDARAFFKLLQSHPSAQAGTLQLKFLLIPEADHSMAFPTTAIHGLSWLFKRSI